MSEESPGAAKTITLTKLVDTSPLDSSPGPGVFFILLLQEGGLSRIPHMIGAPTTGEAREWLILTVEAEPSSKKAGIESKALFAVALRATEITFRSLSPVFRPSLPSPDMVYNRAVNVEESDQVIRAWRESAPYWEKNSEIIHQILAPTTTSMIEEAGISSGQSVLDVAGGAGEPSLTIAVAVDPGGHVVCTDAAPEMVCIAARAAARRGLTNVDFGQCRAESLPFPIASFDIVICRLGAMFFANPLEGLREMLRVLRPRGRLTLAVWSAPDFNPFFRAVTQVMSRHLASPPEDPSAPGAFRFAGQGEIAGLLAQAGAQRVRERIMDFHIAAAVRPEDFWTLRSEMSDTLRRTIAMLTSDQLAQVREEILEATQGYFSEGMMRFPAQVFVVTGERS